MHWLAMLLAALAISWPAWGAAPKGKKAEPPKVEQKAEAPACIGVPIEPLLERVKSSGLEYEIIADPRAVVRISAVLAQNIDVPFRAPDVIIVVFLRDVARIGLVNDGKLCAMLEAPAGAVRGLVRAVHGQSVDI